MKHKVASTREVVQYIDSIPNGSSRVQQAELLCKRDVRLKRNDELDTYGTVIQLFGLKTLSQIACMGLNEAKVAVRKNGSLRKAEINEALLYTRLFARLLILHHKGEYAACFGKNGRMIFCPTKDVKPGGVIEIKV